MYFEEIESIEYSRETETYDLEVPNLHNFILGNGIVSHNSGKSTAAFTIAKYVDPTFPGKKLDDGTGRRSCARIVFTQKQFIDEVDKAKPGKCIVWDEMILGGMTSDHSTEAQKILIKKMVTIRKKRLFIIFVLPSIFMLRMYFAVFRSRASIHFYSPDGIERGYFKFYSYDTKRKLYIRGKKEFNQDAQRSDFIGRTTNTDGYFFDPKEYDDKKEEAIQQITAEPENKKKMLSKNAARYKQKGELLLFVLYRQLKETKVIKTYEDLKDFLVKKLGKDLFSYTKVHLGIMLSDAEKEISHYALEQEALRKFKDKSK